jgi:transposase-like protein
MKSRRQYSAEYKAKIAIETLREANTPSEIASREEINVKQVHNWRTTLLEGAQSVFEQSKTERELIRRVAEAAEREEELMAKVGRLTIENDWLKKKSTELGVRR